MQNEALTVAFIVETMICTTMMMAWYARTMTHSLYCIQHCSKYELLSSFIQDQLSGRLS